jgi:glutamine synthetase
MVVVNSATLSGAATDSRIRGHEREYGSLIMKQPHLLDLSYPELEAKNLDMRAKRLSGMTDEDARNEMLNYLKDEKGIKTVLLAFSDLEGVLQTLEYDREFIIGAEDNLTFDGSSIHGFTELAQSDLRLRADWRSMRWLPADVFGAGKVMVFANVCNEDGTFYTSDFRSNLLTLCEKMYTEKGLVVNVAPEIEGFLFKNRKCEQAFDENLGFELATMSGYFNSLPQDTLRMFIDKFSEVLKALGYVNEKNHPEVAPAQFELNFRFSWAIDTADQIQLYKLIARQVAKAMNLTACFLPKPAQTLNGSGMHTNMSISKADGNNLFYDESGECKLSEMAHRFITGILNRAKDLCLLMNSSVNSYRRLDPNYEAPNEIKYSAIDRGSMVRVPMGNEKSARIEVRTVAPDANPYLYMFGILKAGLEGIEASDSDYQAMRSAVYDKEVEKLPGHIYDALDDFESSEFMERVLGSENKRKFAGLKREVADMSPKALGTCVKKGEVIYHHEVTNQRIKSEF